MYNSTSWQKTVFVFLAFAYLSSQTFAATIYSTATGGNWNTGSSWTGGNPPANGDNAVIINGATITMDVSASRNSGTTTTVSSGGTLVFNNNNTMTGTGSFTLSSGGTLKIGAGNGITTASALGNIQVTGTRTYSTGANYEYNPSSNSVNQVTGDGLPATVNNLTINNNGKTVTLTNTVSPAGNLSITAGTFTLGSNTVNRSTAGGTLTIASGAALNIGGTNTFPSNYSTHSINAASTVNYNGTDQTVAVLNSSQDYGNLTISGSGTKTLAGAENVAGDLTISGGTFDLGSYTINHNPAAGTLSIAAAAGLKIGGTNGFPTNYNTITINATSTVEFSGTNQAVLAQNYGNLTLSNSGTKTFAAGITGIAGAFTINGSATPNLTTNSTTVDYNNAGAQTVAAVNYYNLTLSNSGTKTFAAGTAVIGNAFTISGTATADATTNSPILNFNKAGAQAINAINYYSLTLGNSGIKTFGTGVTGIAGALTVSGSASADATTNSTTINYNGTGAQTVAGFTYYNLTASLGGIRSLASTITVNSNLTVSGGTLDLGGYTANRATPGGTLTVANGSTLKIGGTNTIPSNYSAHSIGATSTIEFSGSNQSVPVLNSSQNYGTLTISGSGTKTISQSITAAATIVSAGTLQIGSGTTGNLTSTGGITNNSSIAFNRSDDFTYAGTITGTGSLVHAGGGSLTLSGQNTYSGGTSQFRSFLCNQHHRFRNRYGYGYDR
jgi:autotransporter-associated beta strand protein